MSISNLFIDNDYTIRCGALLIKGNPPGGALVVNAVLAFKFGVDAAKTININCTFTKIANTVFVRFISPDPAAINADGEYDATMRVAPIVFRPVGLNIKAIIEPIQCVSAGTNDILDDIVCSEVGEFKFTIPADGNFTFGHEGNTIITLIYSL